MSSKFAKNKTVTNYRGYLIRVKKDGECYASKPNDKIILWGENTQAIKGNIDVHKNVSEWCLKRKQKIAS